MMAPKFGEVWQWTSGKVQATIMVIGPEYEPDDAIGMNYRRWQAIHVAAKGHPPFLHRLGVLSEYQLLNPHGKWVRIDG